MRILVTGSEGFIGSHLVEKLVRKGHDLTCLVLYNSFNYWGWLENIDPKIKNNIKIITGDIRDEYLMKSIIKNKSLILIDDSLVRGTTCHKIVKMLYEAGAKEVHVRIACPEIKYPDFYGVDMPTKEELLAHKKNNAEM